MILKKLRIDRLPGIDQPFEIESPGSGVHVIFGPNAIGKSSVCRAVEAVYWADRGPTERISVSAQFEVDGEEWWAEREGTRLRWRSGDDNRAPPGIPGSRNQHCFFLCLRDLIDPSSESTQDIASEIRRQMSGGFDLHQIADDLFSGISTRYGRRQRNEFNAAVREVQAAEHIQSSLLHRQDSLESLQAQLDAAAAAARQLPSVNRAMGLADRTEEHTDVRQKIDSLPKSLERLTGREIKQIREFNERIDELNGRVRDLEGKLGAARNDAGESHLTAEVDRSELKVWRQNVEELSRVELDLENAKTQRAESRQEFLSALAALGGGEVDKLDLTVKEHSRLFEFLRSASDHQNKKGAIEERLQLLASIEQSAGGEDQVVELRAAVDLLRKWLREPEIETLSKMLRARRAWILLALVVAVIGGAMATIGDTSISLIFAAVAGGGVGATITLFLLPSGNQGSNKQAETEVAFDRLDLASPDAWEIKPVEARLRSLEAEAASIESRLQRARDRDTDRQYLKSQLTELSQAEASLNDRRQSLLQSLHLDELPPDADLVNVTRALDQLRAKRIKYEGACGKVDELASKHSGLLSGLTDVLRRHGEPQPENAKDASAYLGNLVDRNSQLVKALDDERQANDLLEQVTSDRNTALESIRQIYAGASLDDGDTSGLTGLLNLLPDFRKLQETATRLEGQIKLDRDELGKADDAELADLERARLTRLAQELSAEAEKADELRDSIAEIKAQVSEARRSSNIQDLIARQEHARVELRDRRDEAIFSTAGKFLLEAVEREYEQSQMPRVFERARGHFSTFTRHGYELRLGRGTKSPRLFAVDLRNRESRELDELSDGTRAQLLLAARMAFAEEVEQGRTLPLFLDEALDQSDPARFEAIARSLGRIANDQGRQIFYLASDPLDRDRIRNALKADDCVIAAEIDLGLARKGAMGVTEPHSLHVPPQPAIPEPEGTSPEEYAVMLGVPAFLPNLGFARQHFFYLLSDDLDLLHAFLECGIEQAGQWRSVSGSPLAIRLTSSTISPEEIEQRVSLLEVFCEAWNQGRGRLVDRDVLVQSRAVSERFFDRVADIAGELDGNSDKLLAAMNAKKDPRLKGFRKNSAYHLEVYLRDNRFLDDRPILDESDLRLRVLASPPANMLADGVASQCLSRWWVWAMKMS